MPLCELMKKGRPKWFLENCKELDRRFESLMTEVGATYEQGRWHEWHLQTKAGHLGLNCRGDQIMTQFKDGSLASKFVGADSHNGKWNFHTFWSICKPRCKPDSRISVDDFFGNFERQLRRVM